MDIKEQKKIVDDLLKKKQLKPNDTFQFKCTACGKCCWNIDVLINCYDMIRIRNGLKLSTKEIFEKNYINFYLGPSSGLPVVTLNFLKMGESKFTHCPFLKPIIKTDKILKKIKEKAKGDLKEMNRLLSFIKTNPEESHKILGKLEIDSWLCSIHKNRPIICRLYPCGRIQKIDTKTKEKKEMFMLQEDQKGFCPGFKEKETTTLKNYLSSQDFWQYQEGSNLFTKIVNFLISNGLYVEMDKNKKSKDKSILDPKSIIIYFIGNLLHNFDSFNTFSKDPRVIKTIYDENSTHDDFMYVENKIFNTIRGFAKLMKEKPSENEFKTLIKNLTNKI